MAVIYKKCRSYTTRCKLGVNMAVIYKKCRSYNTRCKLV